MNVRSLRAAFPYTIPVLAGYLCIGVAFGLMLERAGYGVVWSFLMSLTIYAGSGQYLGVSLLAGCTALGTVALLTFIINFRHLVYGLSMLEKFKGMGKKKLYMIFSLTDETYALLAQTTPPEGVDAGSFYFSIALLDHLYWIAGSVIGSLAGSLLAFDSTGVEFAMTALFLVIAVEQWREKGNRVPALLGLGITLVSRLVMGADNMLIPALILIVTVLLPLRGKLDVQGKEDEPVC